MKSFKPQDPPSSSGPRGGGRNAPADFKSEERSNKTHRSTTDPDARLYRKGSGMEAKLCFIGHGLMENPSGLIVDARLTRVSGHPSDWRKTGSQRTPRWRKADSNRWSHFRVSQPRHRPDVADRQHPSCISNPSCQFNQHLCRKWDQRFESAFLQR
jgi:hypothetical protein